jgi:WD40 repeat protein
MTNRRSFVVAASLAIGFTLVAGVMPGCSCDDAQHRTDGGVGGNGSGDMGVPAIGSITVAPADVTLDLVQGAPPTTQAFTVTFHAASGDQDVTGQSSFALTDPTLGTLNQNVFATGMAHGGTTTLIASFVPPGGSSTQGLATIHVRVKGSFNGPDCMGNACGMFPPDTAPPCAQGNVAPQIYYPPDGVLLPPNMSTIAVHWTPFPGGPPAVPIQTFELAFKNANTDVRILTKCASQLMDTAQPTAQATGGCELVLDQAMWDFIAQSNRGGDAVKVSIRATTDGMCATPSTNSVNVAFAEQDVNGGVYYWKSTVSSNGTGGQIWAKAFGNAVPEENITGGLGSGCYGCHSLSRDGKYMTANQDDDDSDDEYSDTTSLLIDVKAKSMIGSGNDPPGFQAFSADDSLYLGSNGNAQTPTNRLFLYNGMTDAPATPASITVGTAGQRPTMPDWSADGKTVLFVMPAKVAQWNNTFGDPLSDDDHVFGGSIYSMPFDPATKMFGAPTAVVTSAGENNYYPGLSPDGSFIVFNRVAKQTVTNPISGRPDCTGTGMQVTCPNDSFSNPKARVQLLSTKPGAMAVDAENANGSPAASAVDVSNSWPRWSPFVQSYKGDKLLWITFSSTRDYGLKVRNHKSGMFQCYPADSFEQAGGDHGTTFASTCHQPQIWMAAIDLSHLEFNNTDPSFAAFWLPFQDVTTHNHTAQWTQTVVDQPQPDMGACIPNGGDCTKNPNGCCGGICTATGICGIP